MLISIPCSRRPVSPSPLLNGQFDGLLPHLSPCRYPPNPFSPFHRLTFFKELAQILSGRRLGRTIFRSVVISKARYLQRPALMDESSNRTPYQDPSTTRTSTIPELSFPTERSLGYSSTETGYRSSTSPQPDPSPSPDGQNHSPTFLALTNSPLSSSLSLTTTNPSLETSAGPSTTTASKSLNVTAIAVGATGAALLLIVCASIIFYLRKKRQKKRVPPSAEFMDVAFMWRPRAYHEMSSPTSLAFTPRGSSSFTPSLEPLRYKPPISLYSSPPITPPWSP